MSVSSKIQAKKVRVISSTVANLERSLDFYTKALAFKAVSDVTVGVEYSELAGVKPSQIRIATLQLGDEKIELIEYLDLAEKPIPQDSQSNDLWFQHFAIVVSDLDRAYQHLKSFAIKPISTAPQTLSNGIKAFKIISSLERVVLFQMIGKAAIWQVCKYSL